MLGIYKNLLARLTNSNISFEEFPSFSFFVVFERPETSTTLRTNHGFCFDSLI